MNIRLFLSLASCLFFLHTNAQKKKDIQILEKLFETSEVFNKIFTGFALYDPAKDSFLYQHEADKYYTPASNTKILTLYTALTILGDTIPSLFYLETDSTFTFWGSGDPSFLNDALPKDSSVLQFLRKQEKDLYFSNHNFQEKRLGPGWSWDDYNYSYQSERTPFPIYGNVVTFSHLKDAIGFQALPIFFQNKVQLDPKLENRFPSFRRALDANQFWCNSAALMGKKYKRSVPFRYSDELLTQLLSDTLKRSVALQTTPIIPFGIKSLSSDVPADSVYQLMMQESDNFIAEQLLLVASNQVFGVQNTDKIIDFMKDRGLRDLPDELMWVDGSGLSRYNLFTPRSMVKVLEKLLNNFPEKRLLNIFAAGGISGTIEKWYAPEEGKLPYIFAKTGTLSNKHCLSGYVLTESGKTLIFSFMNNNYTKSSTPVKLEMQRMLEYIRDTF